MNRRLDTIQAAVLRVKLPHLDRWNAKRQHLADVYRLNLEGLPLTPPSPEAPGRHVYHLFVVETDDRDGLRAALRKEGIETGIHYPIPLHLQQALNELGYAPGTFPRAERLAVRSLSLPMYPELPVQDVERVAEAIRYYLDD
jgi:dTDP-4-amino-4,6-dideoxygalactose transaminase